MKKENLPQEILKQFQNGNEFKEGIGNGLNEQIEKNIRFYSGDQWHGADTGSKPLVRRNIIKRIGESKQSNIGSSSPISVAYSIEGVDAPKIQDDGNAELPELPIESPESKATSGEELNTFIEVLNGYFRTTAERVKFDDKKAEILKNAYIAGTGVGYTYWDDSIVTGLYADEGKTMPIKGDIQFEVLDIRNIVFGEPNNADLQSQPYIIISQRRTVDSVKREAKRNHRTADIDKIVPDTSSAVTEPAEGKRCTVYTKFYKEWNDIGDGFRIKCCKTTGEAVVKDEWDTGLTLYPITMMNWAPRDNNIYGESDVTWQIPNQIAINRSLTATVWAVMSAGMPITVVNGDIVQGKVSNNPGQILTVYGPAEDTKNAIDFVTPPNFSAPLLAATDSLTDSTLRDNGANDAILGDMNPENASAIIQLKEAAKAPLQLYQNRFYSMIEDIARVWADFWVHNYGVRKLKVRTNEGLFYIPFNAERYKDLIISARIDVGTAAMYSPADTATTILNLYQAGLLKDYEALDAIPETILPNKDKYANRAKEEFEQAMMQAMEQQAMAQMMPEEGQEMELIEE